MSGRRCIHGSDKTRILPIEESEACNIGHAVPSGYTVGLLAKTPSLLYATNSEKLQ